MVAAVARGLVLEPRLLAPPELRDDRAVADPHVDAEHRRLLREREHVHRLDRLPERVPEPLRHLDLALEAADDRAVREVLQRQPRNRNPEILRLHHLFVHDRSPLSVLHCHGPIDGPTPTDQRAGQRAAGITL